MSTTKLPEAFNEKSIDHAPIYLGSSDASAWASGYNKALEATGAKELLEASNKACSVLYNELSALEVGDSETGQQQYSDEVAAREIINAMGMIEAALAKSNPSNIVG